MTYTSIRSILALFVLLLAAAPGNAQVVINEYSCSNLNGPTDAYGEREDWIELYNTSPAAVNLTGFLSDDKFVPNKWPIPAGVSIPANGRLMVFCNDRDTYFGGQLHTSFKLTQTRSEYIILANSAGIIVDSVQLKRTQANHSRGRKTDGSNLWGVFNNPTPNASNANAKDGYATTPSFNIGAGFFNAAQLILLSSPDPAVTIYYTINGQYPSAASTVYSTPIAVNTTTAIRAVAISSNPLILPSFCETNTYFINETNTMNVVSVTGDYPSLFSSAQPIFNSFEFFDKNHQFRFELSGESRKHGNDSWAYQQKGFRIHARDQYGYDHAFKQKFFRTSPRDTFNVIILKAGASDNYPGNANHPGCHMRDVFVHTLAYKYQMEMDGRKYEPAILFINGQYWGVYEIRERVDPDFTEYYYNQTEKKVDILRYWGGLNIEAGSDTGWVNLYNFIMANNMTNASNYAQVTNFLNVKSLIEYFIINTWLVNSDWLNWNTMWWRGRKGSGVKWRYALWDEDNVLGLGENFTGLNTTTFQNDPCQPFDLFQNNSSIKHTDMLVRLMTNPTFEQLYRSTFIDLLNGPLNCNNMLPHFDSIIQIIQPEMQRQSTRWGGNYATWQANVQQMRNEIVGRCAVIAQKLDSCMKLNPQQVSFNVVPAGAGTIKMDNKLLSPYVWTRVMEADTVWNLTATPSGPYYFFDHWEKFNVSNTLSPDDTTSPAAFNFKKKDSVVAYFRYLNLDSILVTFDVSPPGKGTISLNNAVLPSYPYTVKLDRKLPYSLSGLPTANYSFFSWSKQKSSSSLSPTTLHDSVSFSFSETDTVTAHFQYNPGTPTLPNAPALPGLDERFFIPTAFSPNGDGKNDLFRISFGPEIKTIDLKIYDRWGSLVYKSNNRNEGWDGSYKGKPAEMGTYFYSLTVWFSNGYMHTNKTLNGEVTLVR